ncbi:MAG TPA: 2-hydroxy-3-oxopropionate reductase [Anaerolineae bacterium]|nr:2-hydroxy-3-oxopropionate reductase [Anaerolineae bacterium]HIQ06027.1 2-hydroxy-3-oxopropionate reductase [Anaerolineae bacterium]
MQPTIGFIGLGIMGKPMARNLLAAGYSLVVHNRSREPVQELVAAGAAEAFSPREVAARSQVIITMLPDSPDVALVVAGPDGVLEGVTAGDVIIDMSTIAPTVAQELAKKAAAQGVHMLDAPVSGGDIGAQQGTLSIMVGGDEEVFQSCLPIFQVMGKNVVHVGDSGAGQIVKACNQIVVAGTLAVVSEALVLGTKAGVDPAKIVEAIQGGAARCWALEVRAPRVIQRVFDPGFKSKLHYKDLNIVQDTGRAFGVPLPVTSIVHELFAAMQVAGRGELDHSAIITVLEDLAGIEVHQLHKASKEPQ